MAEIKAEAAPAQKAAKANFKAAVLARRLAAVQNAGTMTPKIQRGLDRLAANLAKEGK